MSDMSVHFDAAGQHHLRLMRRLAIGTITPDELSELRELARSQYLRMCSEHGTTLTGQTAESQEVGDEC